MGLFVPYLVVQKRILYNNSLIHFLTIYEIKRTIYEVFKPFPFISVRVRVSQKEMRRVLLMEQTNVLNVSQIQQGVEKTNVNTKASRSFSLYGLGLLVVVLAMIFLPNVITPLLGEEIATAYGMLISYACAYLIGFPIMLLIMRKVPKTVATTRAPKKLKVWQIIGIASIVYVTMWVISTIVGLLEQSAGTNATTTTTDLLGVNTIVLFILGVFVAPVMEEVLFRKIGYERIACYGGGLYIVWTAVLFGLMHGNFGQSIYAGVIGLILAKVTYETGTVKYSMIIHVLVNLTGGVGLSGLILRTGNMTLLSIWGCFILAVVLLGIISTIVFFVKYRSTLKNAPSTTPMTSKKRAFLNIGTILYMVVTLGFIVLGFLF